MGEQHCFVMKCLYDSSRRSPRTIDRTIEADDLSCFAAYQHNSSFYAFLHDKRLKDRYSVAYDPRVLYQSHLPRDFRGVSYSVLFLLFFSSSLFLGELEVLRRTGPVARPTETRKDLMEDERCSRVYTWPAARSCGTTCH